MADQSTSTLLLVLDLSGIFVFAISGALVAVRKELDVFGVLVLAGTTGLGGGFLRDVLINATPPAALAEVIPHLDQPPGFLRHPFLAFIRQFFHEALTIRMKSAGLQPDQRRLFTQFVAWLDDETKALRPDGRSLVETAEPSTQLDRIAAPLLIIGARDDTVFPPVALDLLARVAKSQPLVHVEETPHGGHIGIGAAYPEWFAPLCARFAWLAPMLRPPRG
jgi:pimeloyl-ACP methyl ester carboxylesterase